jgi:lipoprotein-anchoring transpeptidase ErfK/SrfK
MTSDSTGASQALKNAYEALQRGDKPAARRWAWYASSLAPGLEEPWLILAAAASPQASVAYLQKALLLNPHSGRAQAGMRWARRRLQTRAEKSTESTEPVHSPVPSPPKAGWKLPPLLDTLVGTLVTLDILVFVMLVAATLYGIAARPTSIVFAEVPISARINMLVGQLVPANPTLPLATPTATAAVTETVTPGYTPTNTSTPSPTATLVPTGTSLPTGTPTDTPSPIPPTPKPPSGPKRIVVVISEQRLYAYQGEDLVYKFVASTGASNNTPVGSFTVLDKDKKPYSYAWGFWMPYWLGFYWEGDLEDGIHSPPLLADGSRLWEDSIGTPVSYGCVVLSDNDTQRIYDWADIGTSIEIRR